MVDNNNYISIGTQYISRISIVFLIEIFAFFFLRLYSQTLGELRYTHNEITNIEMKIVGLQIAIAVQDKKGLTAAIENAIKTERNFILDKGKTTVDLERYRRDVDYVAQTVGSLKEALLPRTDTAQTCANRGRREAH